MTVIFKVTKSSVHNLMHYTSIVAGFSPGGLVNHVDMLFSAKANKKFYLISFLSIFFFIVAFLSAIPSCLSTNIGIRSIN